MAILVIDIGNTSTSIGLYRRGRIAASTRCPTRAAPSTIVKALRSLRGVTGAEGAMVASVVPPVNRMWEKLLAARVDGPVGFVRHDLTLGVGVTYPNPESIGADRLANACEGRHRYGVPLIVADFGTAVTFDVLTERDGYVGGVIGAGLPLVFEYLAEKTALLPKLDARPVRSRIGRSTEEAMQIGAHWGYRGLVREITTQLLAEPALRGARLVATGGYAARVVRGLTPRYTVDADLTLRGIGRIFELNHGTGGTR